MHRYSSLRVSMIDTQAIRKRWQRTDSKHDEREWRLFAAGAMQVAGWRGLEAGRRGQGSGRWPVISPLLDCCHRRTFLLEIGGLFRAQLVAQTVPRELNVAIADGLVFRDIALQPAADRQRHR